MVYKIKIVYEKMITFFFEFSLLLFGFEYREFRILYLKFGFLSGV